MCLKYVFRFDSKITKLIPETSISVNSAKRKMKGMTGISRYLARQIMVMAMVVAEGERRKGRAKRAEERRAAAAAGVGSIRRNEEVMP